MKALIAAVFMLSVGNLILVYQIIGSTKNPMPKTEEHSTLVVNKCQRPIWVGDIDDVKRMLPICADSSKCFASSFWADLCEGETGK